MRVTVVICLVGSIIIAILTADEAFEMEMAKTRRSLITVSNERGEQE